MSAADPKPMRYVIVPGIDGSDDQHWQTIWEQAWGGAATRIRPGSWSAPELGDWVDAVDEAVRSAAHAGCRIVLVAHSLGCWAAAAWLGARPPGLVVAGALMVAPPDPEGPAFPRQAASTFLDVVAEPLTCPALVVGSTNDPYCSRDRAESFAGSWEARWHLAGPYGHLNSASGIGRWHEGHDLLESLIG